MKSRKKGKKKEGFIEPLLFELQQLDFSIVRELGDLTVCVHFNFSNC